ncbi:MAG: PH domain-containing protein [Oscillospiraceae bacterium]|nr:PH domain-containing protein [Oscillospiraceae bacterium]
MKRQHPIALIRYTSKNFWLLLIPLLRGLFALKFDFYSWLSGAYLDILVVLIILGAAFFRWWNVAFEAEENGLMFHIGFFVNREFFVPYSAMTSLTAKHTFILRPIKAVTIFIDTDTQSVMNKASDSDVKVVLKLNDYKQICDKMPNRNLGAKLIYKASKGKLLFFSFVFSSTLSSLIYFGTLLIQGGRLIGEELEERFITAVNDVTKAAERIIGGITPFTVAVIIVIGGGWLYSFIANYLRHINFKIQKCGESISVENGFFTKWEYFINSKKINYVDLQQNLLMKIFSAMSVHVSCTGYGKQKNEIPVFVPITDKKSVAGVMKMFLPEYEPSRMEICPRWNYIMRFIGPAAAVIFLIIIAAFAGIMLLPGWYSVIFFLAIMGEIVSVHWLIVRLEAFYTNGIGMSDDGVGNINRGEGTVAIRYCHLFKFHYIIVQRDKITAVEIKQTPFQKMNDSCDLVFYIRSERVKSHRIRGLNLKDAEKMAGRLGYSVNC